MRKVKEKAGPKKGAGDAELSALPAAVAKKTQFAAFAKMEGWKPASKALDYARAVRTCFPDFNKATRIGGLPLRRITTIHGPTHGGKSAFIGGLIRSFIEAVHVAGYCDAEHATDLAFFDEIMGAPVKDFPNFFGMRPKSYQETIDSIDEFLKNMKAERKARGAKPGSPDDLAGILVVDSINKLTPERELERIKKDGGEAMDKGWGRNRAAMNQAWLDHVIPLLGDAETALVLIAQEREDPNAEPWEIPTPKGGKAIAFDSSLICRVMKSSPVREGDDPKSDVYGFRHKVRIWKSKVGHMDGRYTDCCFHFSNGLAAPPGLDLGRDLIFVGKAIGIIETAGSWLSFGKKRWQGENRAVAALVKDPALFAELAAAINARIETDAGRGEK